MMTEEELNGVFSLRLLLAEHLLGVFVDSLLDDGCHRARVSLSDDGCLGEIVRVEVEGGLDLFPLRLGILCHSSWPLRGAGE